MSLYPELYITIVGGSLTIVESAVTVVGESLTVVELALTVVDGTPPHASPFNKK